MFFCGCSAVSLTPQCRLAPAAQTQPSKISAVCTALSQEFRACAGPSCHPDGKPHQVPPPAPLCAMGAASQPALLGHRGDAAAGMLPGHMQTLHIDVQGCCRRDASSGMQKDVAAGICRGAAAGTHRDVQSCTRILW